MRWYASTIAIMCESLETPATGGENERRALPSVRGDEVAAHSYSRRLTNLHTNAAKYLTYLERDGTPLPEPLWTFEDRAVRISKKAREIHKARVDSGSSFITPMSSFRSGTQTFEHLAFDSETYPEYFASTIKDQPDASNMLDYRGRVVLPVPAADSEPKPWMEGVDSIAANERFYSMHLIVCKLWLI